MCFRSTNSGATYTRVLSNAVAGAVTDLAMMPRIESTFYAAAQGSYPVYKSADGGLTWQPSSSGLPSGAVLATLAMSPTIPGLVVLAVGGNPGTTYSSPSLFQSQDGGTTWQPMATGNTMYCQCGWDLLVAFDPGDSSTLLPQRSAQRRSPSLPCCAASFLLRCGWWSRWARPTVRRVWWAVAAPFACPPAHRGGTGPGNTGNGPPQPSPKKENTGEACGDPLPPLPLLSAGVSLLPLPGAAVAVRLPGTAALCRSALPGPPLCCRAGCPGVCGPPPLAATCGLPLPPLPLPALLPLAARLCFSSTHAATGATGFPRPLQEGVWSRESPAVRCFCCQSGAWCAALLVRGFVGAAVAGPVRRAPLSGPLCVASGNRRCRCGPAVLGSLHLRTVAVATRPPLLCAAVAATCAGASGAGFRCVLQPAKEAAALGAPSCWQCGAAVAVVVWSLCAAVLGYPCTRCRCRLCRGGTGRPPWDPVAVAGACVPARRARRHRLALCCPAAVVPRGSFGARRRRETAFQAVHPTSPPRPYASEKHPALLNPGC